MNTQTNFKTRVTFGFVSENGSGERDSQQGDIEIPEPAGTLAELQTQATTLVKNNPHMQELLYAFIDDAEKLVMQHSPSPDELWDYHYAENPQSVWTDWTAPESNDTPIGTTITSTTRWKPIQTREWQKTDTTIRAYYRLTYPNTLDSGATHEKEIT